MTKTDCFAYRPCPERCSALNDLYCKYEPKCNFYKPKKNTQTTVYRAGSTTFAVKLTPEDVVYIRENYIARDKEFGTLALAQKFGVDRGTIYKIVENETWREE